MTRMFNPDLWDMPEVAPRAPKRAPGADVPQPDLETRKAEVRDGFIKAGIGVARPDDVLEAERNSKPWTWQAVGRWSNAEDHRGRFSGILARCDQHPRLERVTRSYYGGARIVVHFVNGVGYGTWAAAIEALGKAEEKGKAPGAGETFLTYVAPVIEAQAAGEPATSELESLEASE